eukprot:1969186-Alexandrium_andersonii.AAC.1
MHCRLVSCATWNGASPVTIPPGSVLACSLEPRVLVATVPCPLFAWQVVVAHAPTPGPSTTKKDVADWWSAFTDRLRT